MSAKTKRAAAKQRAATIALPDLSKLPCTALVDDKATAAALGTTPGTLCTWRCTGRVDLPFVKIGRNVRYRVGDILAFIERGTRLHTGEGAP